MFAAAEPVPVEAMAEALDLDERTVELLLEELRREYSDCHRGIQVDPAGGGYQFTTKPELAGYIQRFRCPTVTTRLSQAALETLAIIAYRQPITKAEIENIRGVKVDSVINSLLERGLIEEQGRREGPGRPLLFGTTRRFLEHFGLTSLEDLPPLPAAESVSKPNKADNH